MPKRKGRMTVSRRRAIIEQVKESGEVLITDLSKQFAVSEVTIRNDLEYLESKKLVMRARGGAFNVESHVGTDQSIFDKNKIHSVEKSAIGKKSAELITENDTIILDSGTTTAEIAKNLGGFQQLTVITNAINIINIMMGLPNINLIVPGGVLRQNSMSLKGPLAEKSLTNFFVDKAFISTDGFDTRQGIFTPNLEEASLNMVMIAAAKHVILVTDSSKFTRKSLVFICGLEKIKTVVTDAGIPEDDRKRLEDAGIQVIIA
ncbi:MAG: DeoR/GlpR transcriptional regulator [Chitinophagaceae bacterium]|nr:DeoR/GlpR transcriptional regulator [Chitinophagaceae bacterium]